MFYTWVKTQVSEVHRGKWLTIRVSQESLTCHSNRSRSVINTNNEASLVPGSWYCTCWLSHSIIVSVITNTFASPIRTSQNAVKNGLLYFNVLVLHLMLPLVCSHRVLGLLSTKLHWFDTLWCFALLWLLVYYWYTWNFSLTIQGTMEKKNQAALKQRRVMRDMRVKTLTEN